MFAGSPAGSVSARWVVVLVAVLLVGAFALIAYRRSSADDPGMTTEIALVLRGCA